MFFSNEKCAHDTPLEKLRTDLLSFPRNAINEYITTVEQMLSRTNLTRLLVYLSTEKRAMLLYCGERCVRLLPLLISPTTLSKICCFQTAAIFKKNPTQYFYIIMGKSNTNNSTSSISNSSYIETIGKLTNSIGKCKQVYSKLSVEMQSHNLLTSNNL